MSILNFFIKPKNFKYNIHCIFVRYGSANNNISTETINKWFQKYIGYTPSIIRIENKKNELISIQENNTYYGSNKSREFSGYTEGLEILKSKKKISKDDYILFFNDTFATNYGSDYLFQAEKRNIIGALKKRHIIGYIDRYPASIRIKEMFLRSWIRTSFFLLPAETLQFINFKCMIKKNEIFDQENFNPNFFHKKSEVICTRYKQYLKNWLFGDDTNNSLPEKWHTFAPLGPSNFKGMIDKCFSILTEHSLSLRIKLINKKVYDLNENKTSKIN